MANGKGNISDASKTIAMNKASALEDCRALLGWADGDVRPYVVGDLTFCSQR